MAEPDLAESLERVRAIRKIVQRSRVWLRAKQRKDAAAIRLDPRIVNGKTREVTVARFAPITQVKVRP